RSQKNRSCTQFMPTASVSSGSCRNFNRRAAGSNWLVRDGPSTRCPADCRRGHFARWAFGRSRSQGNRYLLFRHAEVYRRAAGTVAEHFKRTSARSHPVTSHKGEKLVSLHQASIAILAQWSHVSSYRVDFVELCTCTERW